MSESMPVSHEQTHCRTLVNELLTLWHSSLKPLPGFKFASIVRVGEDPVAVSSWGRPHARAEDSTHTLEHYRMAKGPECPYPGSKILSLDRRSILSVLPGYDRAIAYVDATIHKGIVYRADNWQIVYEAVPTSHTWGNREGHHGKPCYLRTKFERPMGRLS